MHVLINRQRILFFFFLENRQRIFKSINMCSLIVKESISFLMYFSFLSTFIFVLKSTIKFW